MRLINDWRHGTIIAVADHKGQCTCGLGPTYKVGHSDWCDLFGEKTDPNIETNADPDLQKLVDELNKFWTDVP